MAEVRDPWVEDFLDLTEQEESRSRNVHQNVVPPGGGYNPSVGRVTGPSSAQGWFQFINPTWQTFAKQIGVDVDKWPNAKLAPYKVQRDVARHVATTDGVQHWTKFNKDLAAKAKELGYPLSGPISGKAKMADDAWINQFLDKRFPVPSTDTPNQIEKYATPVGNPPGVEKEMERNVEAWNEAQANAVGYATRNFQLNQALRSLDKLKEQGGSTGPGTETLNYIRSFLLANTPSFLQNLGIKPDDVKTASFNELNKYLIQYAQGRANTISPATNAGLSTTLMGSPNVELSTSAVDDLLKYTMAVERMNQAGVQNFINTGEKPQKYLDYATKFYGEADPRAYVLDLLAPEKVDEIFNNLKDDQETKRLVDQVNMAEQLGLIRPRQ